MNIRSMRGPGHGAMIGRLVTWLWASPWLLLCGTTLFWAGNANVGRALVGVMPPVMLSFLRWVGAFLIVLPFAWRYLRHDWPIVRKHWRIMLVLSFTGVACFNVMLYLGLTTTTAVNGVLMQSSQPLLVIVWAALLGIERPTPARLAGVVVSLLGVAVIATRGDMGTLAELRVNRGDLWVVLGSVIYGLYIAALRWRPDIHPLSFLAVTFAGGVVMIAPFMLAERASGATISAGFAGWIGVSYIMLFPSLIAYLLFNRGVELAGPGRAGQAVHLVPVFGTILAVFVLGESFHGFHAVGIALIAAGILLASITSVQTRGVLSRLAVRSR